MKYYLNLKGGLLTRSCGHTLNHGKGVKKITEDERLERYNEPVKVHKISDHQSSGHGVKPKKIIKSLKYKF